MSPPDLWIVLRSRKDGRVVLHAERADGSVTWQVHEGPRAWFFPFHDLTHLAVEQVLGTRDGFFGLLAAGWDIDDTGGRGTRGELPDEAAWVEQIVGLFDRDRVGGAAPLTADEVNGILATVAAAGARKAPCLTEPDVAGIRAERERLLDAWASTSHGSELRLAYRRPAASALALR